MAHNPESFRLRFTFWLDVAKEAQAALADEIANLKDKRLFVRAVRDGITLILSLWRGEVETLLSMFPEVEREILARHDRNTDIDNKQSGGGRGISQQALEIAVQADFARQDGLIMAKLESLEKMLASGAMPSESIPAQKPNILTAPQGTDDLIDLLGDVSEAKQDATNNTAWNMIIQNAMYVGAYGALSDEMIVYGQKKGIIPANFDKHTACKKVQQAQDAHRKGRKSSGKNGKQKVSVTDLPTRKSAAEKAKPGNAKKMIVPEVTPPTFDDFEELQI